MTGADGASVGFAPIGDLQADAVTVRLARDGTGAPPLPEGYAPAGGVYAFTPLGMAAGSIEVRVPFDANALGGAQPSLMIAMPEEGWVKVGNARVDGSAMVAEVPMLSHAAVMSRTSDADGDPRKPLDGQLQKASLYISATLSVDAATAPPLPQPGTNGVTTVTVPTNLALRTSYTGRRGAEPAEPCASTPSSFLARSRSSRSRWPTSRRH